MEGVRWGLGGILGILSLAIIVLNWQYPIRHLIAGKGSAIPLVGGTLGAVACWILPPSSGLVGYWWLPLLLDFGCAGGLIAAVPVVVIRKLRH